MAEHLIFSEHMTPAPMDERIRATYLGQAHIAGTGPDGKTCRECIFWRLFGHRKTASGQYEEYVKPHAYFGKKHATNPGGVKKHKCTRPIANKAKRMIPHYALACRLFEANDHPPMEHKVEQ